MNTNQNVPEEMSSAQILYIKKHRQHHHFITAMRFLVLLFFLMVWELAARFSLIDTFFFSSPSLVAAYFLKMLKDGSFVTNTGITVLETLISFLLITLISLLTATVLWYSRTLSEIFEPYLVVLNSLPKSALAPLFIVWLGTGIDTIIVAGISVALFGSMISLYTSFKSTSEEKLKLIYTLGGSRFDALRKVVLPASIPAILSNMKVNIGLALVGVIIGEFLAARRGLGYLIIYGSQVFRMWAEMTEMNIRRLITGLLARPADLYLVSLIDSKSCCPIATVLAISCPSRPSIRFVSQIFPYNLVRPAKICSVYFAVFPKYLSRKARIPNRFQ